MQSVGLRRQHDSFVNACFRARRQSTNNQPITKGHWGRQPIGVLAVVQLAEPKYAGSIPACQHKKIMSTLSATLNAGSIEGTM